MIRRNLPNWRQVPLNFETAASDRRTSQLRPGGPEMHTQKPHSPRLSAGNRLQCRLMRNSI